MSDGVGFLSGTSRAINISPPLTSDRANHTAIAFAEAIDVINNYRLIAENGTASFNSELGIASGGEGVFEWRFGDPVLPAGGSFTAGWHTFAGVKNGSLFTGYVDGTSGTSTPSTSTNINIAIGGSGNTQVTWQGKIALALFSNAHMTPASVQAIRNLYRQTLGLGLGLP
jgi:hypothetical protein